MNTKLLKYSILLVGFTALYACKDEIGESSIDDYFLNYEIKEIAVKSDIPVGAYLYNSAGPLQNEDIWTRLTEERIEATGNVGPYVRPVLGQYGLGVDTLGAIALQQMIDWGNEAAIDFFILPAVNEDRNHVYPQNISVNDGAFIDLFRMKNDTLPRIDLKGMHFALMVNMDGFCSGLNNSNLLESQNPTHIVETEIIDPDRELEPGETHETVVVLDTLVPRVDQMYAFYQRISDYFSDPNYYHTNGRPVVIIRNPERVYSSDSYKLYEGIREAIRKHTGKEVYLIAQQEQWTPPARFHYFHLQGKVDAITVRNMCNVGGGNWERTYMLPQMMNENLKYNREYARTTYGVDFVPPVSTSYNYYPLSATAYGEPQVPKNPDEFKKYCNVAKMNLGNNPMVIVDAFNNWETNSAIEPTVEGYGTGYGTLYLKLVKEQFKK
ncbi:MAG: hypothetical protein EZS26_001916 [Candidatus Ordinivivax streblomastigis]|uniref:Uncharacterized protein n=1 Tax=Candidatus Ordinivivax streblomastigis TaxID=2540710 RepID=A0A5M8P0F8_9BACT|nr:MAG: hypothetical protein EZS26_001916 [Candidatus Ordinivivax streblomastigis]